MLNKNIIYDYINKLNIEDIYNFGLKQGITLSNDDLNTIYYYVKNRYVEIINNTYDILYEIKDKVSNEAYNKLLELYNKYKYLLKKISN